MITFGRAVILAIFALALGSGQASAQTNNCGPREQVLDRLATKYGETRQSMGLGAQGQVMEVFASPQSRSWTITVTLPNGMTCLVASGQSYEALAEALQKPEIDA